MSFINPKIVNYQLNPSLHFLGSLTAKVSLIIDTFPISTVEFDHETMIGGLKVETEVLFKAGIYTNYIAIHPQLNNQILKLLQHPKIPIDLYQLWIDQNLLIVPLSCFLYMKSKDDWNQEIGESFIDKLPFAISTKTYVLSIYIKDHLKKQANINYPTIQFL